MGSAHLISQAYMILYLNPLSYLVSSFLSSLSCLFVGEHPPSVRARRGVVIAQASIFTDITLPKTEMELVA